VDLVGFIIRIYHVARSPERQIYLFMQHILAFFAENSGCDNERRLLN